VNPYAHTSLKAVNDVTGERPTKKAMSEILLNIFGDSQYQDGTSFSYFL